MAIISTACRVRRFVVRMRHTIKKPCKGTVYLGKKSKAEKHGTGLSCPVFLCHTVSPTPHGDGGFCHLYIFRICHSWILLNLRIAVFFVHFNGVRNVMFKMSVCFFLVFVLKYSFLCRSNIWLFISLFMGNGVILGD